MTSAQSTDTPDLAAQVAALTATVDTLSRVMQRMVVNQQLAVAMPKIMASVKSGMTEQIAAPGALEAWLEAQVALPGTPPA